MGKGKEEYGIEKKGMEGKGDNGRDLGREGTWQGKVREDTREAKGLGMGREGKEKGRKGKKGKGSEGQGR